MTELSQLLSIDNSAITGLIDRLEKVGYVERSPSSRDRRKFLIHITSKGVEEIRKAKGVVETVNDRMSSGFTVEEIDIFKKILKSSRKFNSLILKAGKEMRL